MDRRRTARSHSFSAPQPTLSATVLTAPKDLAHMPPTRTVTEHEVRGFTQATPAQHPTVYLMDAATHAPAGRVTQEHLHADNVGAHPQHGPEAFFGNVPRSTLRSVDRAFPNARGTTRNHLAAALDLAMPQPAHQPRRLVELFRNAQGQIISSHRSRSAFEDLSGPGMQEARQRMIQSLRSGPVSADPTRNLSIQASGARDDWHV